MEEDEGGRRTRSGRKASASTPVTPSTRSTRRSKKVQEQIIECTDDEQDYSKIEEVSNMKELLVQEVYDGRENNTDLMQSNTINEINMAELAEPELNEIQQLLSADMGQSIIITEQEVDDQTQFDDQTQIEIIEEQYDDNMLISDMNKISEEYQRMPSDIQHLDHHNQGIVEDENNSSFPFGNVQQFETSAENKIEDMSNNHNEIADSSLLASLAGDNANSLPGEESQSNFIERLPETHLGQSITIEDDEDTHSENAIAEDLQNGSNATDKTSNQADAEMVSEDELQNQSEQKAKVNDPGEVSTEQLITLNSYKVSADNENVSDDEFSAANLGNITSEMRDILKGKRKADTGNDEYNPGSPTGEESNDAAPEKKTKLDDIEDIKNEKKKLPDLDKYWKTVKDDPSDFTGWTYLLQYVDQETDFEAAREAYDAFLLHYPYCYGYWRKYADYEKKKANDMEKCLEVFERGLKAIPLSVDLWIHYLAHVKASSTNEEYIRSQFSRAVTACGLEFRSDKLWEAFIKWEMEGKRYSQIVQIYDRLLCIPTQGYNGHFDSFQDLISSHPASLTASVEEFKKLRREVREAAIKSHKEKKDSTIEVEIAAGVDKDEDEPDDYVKNEEEMNAIKDKIISIRRKLHKSTVAAVTARWTFEEGIKRPYFHVKPLERSQLKNWSDYIDFEIENGDRKRIIILFERCLIACALYDEFWLKLIRYLESILIQDNDSETKEELTNLARDAYTRACSIHHPDKPSLHLMWSAFEECELNYDKASEILINIEKHAPNLLQIAYRRINLERRRGNYESCEQLYEHYIETAKNKNIVGSLAIKYARFLHKVQNNIAKGLNVLKETLEKDVSNTRIALQWIDLALQRDVVNEKEIVEIMDNFASHDNMDLDQKVMFAQRKVEFLEDFGSSARGLQDAQRTLQVALNKANEMKKKSESSPTKSGTPKPPNPTQAASSTTAAYSNSNYYTSQTTPQQQYYNNGQQQSYQQSYDGYGYNHWQYGLAGYSGYSGQWNSGNYGSYY